MSRSFQIPPPGKGPAGYMTPSTPDLSASPACRDSTGRSHEAVVEVAACDCRIIDYEWPYVAEHRSAIDRHWNEVTRTKTSLFDGLVFVTSAYAFEGNQLRMSLFETRFRNYVHWREQGFPTGGVVDGFGSAIIRAADGAILLVRQQAGHLNEGLHYFPSGFIDRNDVDATGRVDLAASIAREVAEETGLSPDELDRKPGFVIARAGPLLAICVELASPLSADALAGRISAFLEREADPEVAALTFVRKREDLEHLHLAPHCALLLPNLL